MKKQIFMTTVSSIALTSASAGVAIAQDAAPKAEPKFSLTLEGGFGRLDSAPMDKWGSSGGPGFTDKAGAGDSMAYTGAISLKRSIGENRDVRFGLGFGGNPSNIYSDMLSGGDIVGPGIYPGVTWASVSVSNDFNSIHMDIDTGRSMNVALGNLTAFGGVRGLVTSSASTSFSDKVGNDPVIAPGIDPVLNPGNPDGLGNYTGRVGFDVTSDFVGVGPRLGVGFQSKPFAGGFGVSAEVAGSVALGQRSDRAMVDKVGTSEVNGDLGPISIPYLSNSEKQTVQTMEAKASIDYHISENATLSLGYQARQFWNVDAFSEEGNGGKSRLVDGAYIAFTTAF